MGRQLLLYECSPAKCHNPVSGFPSPHLVFLLLPFMETTLDFLRINISVLIFKLKHNKKSRINIAADLLVNLVY